MEGETESKIAVLIADDNPDIRGILSSYMGQYADLRVVGTAEDGLQTLEMIERHNPDIVVLDLIMPGIDGLGVLERLDGLRIEKKPLFLVLTAIGQDVFIQKALACGAEYYLVKPFDVEVLVTRIRQIYHERNFCSLLSSGGLTTGGSRSGPHEKNLNAEAVVTGLIRELGIPPHMTGYQYMREAVLQTVKSTKPLTPVTKVLYPAVAQKFSSTPQKVERAIRNAIDSAWLKPGGTGRENIFGHNSGKPTNSQFISAVAERAKMLIQC